VTDFDLNLLRVLTAITETGSVSRAAEKLGMSQPGLSSALTRLRERLQDPLFVRTAHGMLPTPRAQQLHAVAAEALARIDPHLSGPSRFDPGSARDEFCIAMGDAGEPRILPPLLDHLQQHAPGVRVRTMSPFPDELGQMLESGQADLAIGYYPELDGHSFLRQRLYSQGFRCMARADHSLIGKALTMQIFQDCGHVTVTSPQRSQQSLERHLRQHRIERRVVLKVPHFMSLPMIVRHTDLLAVVPFPFFVGHTRASDHALRLLELPFPAPSFSVCQYWHRRYGSNPRHHWLRQTIGALFQTPGLRHPGLKHPTDA